MDKRLRFMTDLIAPLRVAPGSELRLSRDHDPGYTGGVARPQASKRPITAFLVDKDSPGLTVTRGPDCVSNRGYHQCELSFTNCRVPARNLLGEEGRGFDLMSEWLCATRLTVAATSVGRAWTGC